MEYIKKNINKIIICLIILIIVLILFLILKNKNEPNNKIENEYKLYLLGSSVYTLNVGEEYKEPGFLAFDLNNKDATDLVTVRGSVDYTKEGTYEIVYQLKDKKIIRTVIVKTNEENEFNEEDIIFQLIGEDTINLDLGSNYEELGYIATYKNENIEDFVEIIDNVDVLKSGNYLVKYILTYQNYKQEIVRVVNVQDNELKININWDQNTYYKDSISVNIKIDGSSYSYLTLPDKTVTNKSNYNYNIKENGLYTFIAFNKNNQSFEKTIQINQIDNEIDQASCTINLYRNKSIIKINAKDTKSGIKNYQFNNVYYNSNSIEISKRLLSAKIKVFDNVNNYKEISCDLNEIEKEVYGFILIGDSRFAGDFGMKKHLGTKLRSTDTIIAKGAQGYVWFESTAVKEVNKILKNNPDKIYYIMTNLGYNDRTHDYRINQYITLLNKLADNEWKNHVLGFISVNPYMSGDQNDSTNKLITNFNNGLKSGLKNYYYCDTYNGIGFSNFKKISSKDKVHYDSETNIKIYNYIINNCAF